MTLKLSQPWAYTPEEFADGLFFHGSIEPRKNSLPHAGGYDGAFWTADKPLIAQTYIPQWGGSTLISLPRHRPDDPIAPNKYRSEEHPSKPQSLIPTSYALYRLKKNKQ